MRTATAESPAGGAARKGAVWALYLAVLAPLVFSSRTIYPYVLPRAFYFRALVAGAAAVALYLLATRRRSGPGLRGAARDPFLLALGAFVVVQVLAGLVGAAPGRSLFGDMERMGGALAWAHSLAFYVALRALATRSEIVTFLRIAMVATALVGSIALLQIHGLPVGVLPGTGEGRAIGTLGNAGYLGVYALFGLALAGLIWHRAAGPAWRLVAGAAVVVNAATLWFTFTRAALLGAGAGLLVGLVAFGVMGSGARRRWSLAAAGGLVLVAALAGSGLWSRALGPTGELARLTDVSLGTYGLRTRVSVWRGAVRQLGETPLTGLGPENFRVAFDRQFDPRHYGIDPAETHYTKAHNAVLEALVAGGVPGGLAYLALWIALLYALVAARREGRLSPLETALLGGVFSAYFVYLLFWFHDRNSTPLLLALAAFVAHRRAGGPLVEPGGSPSVTGRGARVAIAAGLGLVVVADVAHHGRVLAAGHQLLAAAERGTLAERVARYERALALRPPGAEEAVTEYVGFLNRLPGAADQIARDPGGASLVRDALGSGRRALAEQIHRDPRNPRLRREAGRLYVTSYQLERRRPLLDSAAIRLREAIELGPGRLRNRHMLGEVHLMRNRPREAVRVLEEGLREWDGFGETHYFLAKALLVAGAHEEGATALVRAYGLGYRPPSPAVAQGLYRELSARGADEAAARLRRVVEGDG